ncbi:binder of USO1 and GRH1 protein 1 isoform X6 [Ziziphus jujuba]|uniref:Binder of USO1 and GRH1 protein 1 isoform X6 n=1 Tax=Ziziphus jujuba TaxID=326968 RepID=A0A6P4B6X4_ZIZJJ|nr:binder of USO1 and GRH1 protein 1 isoform X6 [Ziziphus jujuba]
MEDEKKKKKNKKKKNKQTKNVAEEVVVGRGETSSVDQNHSNGKDDQGQVSEAADVRNDVHDVDADLHRHQPNGTECSTLAESEQQQWLQRVATLEEIIKQLQTEKDMHIQREASLENTIEQLRKENNSHLQKEASLEMKIRQLQDEKDSLLQKEVQVGLEEKINRLTDEKITWDLKEASLQERIKHLEGEKDSLMLKEDITKESIANLNHDIARLRVQVLELEESRNNVLQENQQLVAQLQLQIKDFETISSTQPSDEVTKQPSELEDLNSQVEAACALVEKLITENADLVEKVNELYVELDRHTAIARLSSTASAPDPMSPVTTSVPDPLSPIKENTVSISIQKSDSVEGIPVKEERNGISKTDSDHADEILKSSTSDASSEIVQIPLEENAVRDLELQVAETDTEAVVPLSEAPLIGAPFRLVSFVARYVSGSDLVNRNSFDSNR